jgi:AmmeMemoRadiSam system protein A
MSNTDLGAALLSAARHALDRAFGHQGVALPRHPELDAPGATFVTLTQQGELRGCVGTLEARWSLQRDVEQNAFAAAFQDPRFAPLRAGELPYTRIEVSLLSSPVPLSFADEDDLLQRLRPGIDGVVLEWRGRRATFLPQVWDHLSDPREFIAALKDKAGVTEKFWHDGIRVSRYAVDKWKESEAQT